MDPMDTKCSPYPLAKLVNVQLGLLTTKDIMQISVYDKRGDSVIRQSELTDSRLGLPNAELECKSCGEKDSCEGHFGHLTLPSAVYHPNFVPQIVKILNSVCLSCFSLKKGKKRRRVGVLDSSKQDILDSGGKFLGTDCLDADYKDSVKKEGFYPSIEEETNSAPRFRNDAMLSNPKQDPEDINMGVSQYDDRCCEKEQTAEASGISNSTGSCKTMPTGSQSLRRYRARSCKLSRASVSAFIDLTKDNDTNDSACQSTENQKNDQSKDICKDTGKHRHRPDSVSKKHKGTPLQDSCTMNSNKKAKNGARSNLHGKNECKYCKGSYPKLEMKVERKTLNTSNIIEKIYIKFDDKSDGIPVDYLKFLGKKFEGINSRTHYLLPSEVLKIFRQLSDRVVRLVGMDHTIARPEALVLECLLIPPNCNRISEKPGSGNMRVGTDKVTQMLRKILRKIELVKNSTSADKGKRVEIDDMQMLLGDYFRIKGAPKVRGNKEPTIDQLGRSKGELSKAWRTKIFDQTVVKASNFSSRAVLSGDPFLGLNEIGVSFEMAKAVTVCETVTKFNINKLQEFVNNGPKTSRKTGALQIVRSGVKFDLSQQRDPFMVEVGDIVGRHLEDGDLVFCNRPPSVHKHSVVGLKTRLLDISTFAINPLICPPLGADFDGDCVHVFVPQSLVCRAEVEELFLIQKQMLMSHGGQSTFVLTQDALLAAHKLSSSHVFLNKETMQQSCMWTSSALPAPAIQKSPKGSFWTGNQLLELPLPGGIDYDKFGVHIRNSEILATSDNSEWLTCPKDGILQTIIQRWGNDMALQHLDCCQRMLVDWLSKRGFSAGLQDVSSREACREKILQGIDSAKACVKRRVSLLSSLTDDSKKLEKIAIELFQNLLFKVENTALKHAFNDNSFLSMVRAGSKGSMDKFMRQFGFLGLQLYKGRFLHPAGDEGSFSSCLKELGVCGVMQNDSEEYWEERGLIRNSFVQGLTPQEFYIHTVSSREGLIRQALEVKEPGCLFKDLMLFMRDLYLAYDGTVRNNNGKALIQFQYGGWKELQPSTNHGTEALTYRNDKEKLSGNAIQAGDPVGILAATAIVQPAYQMLLESSQKFCGMTISPLKLLQETLYSRKKSCMAYNDWRVFLHVSKGHHTGDRSREQAALQIQHLLRNITLETLSSSTWIVYEPDMVTRDFQGNPSAKMEPWIGHISLNKLAMDANNITEEKIFQKLSTIKDNKIIELGHLWISWRERCDSSCPGSTCSNNGPCIHFCLSFAQGFVSPGASQLDTLSTMRDDVLPFLLQTSIIGHDCIESVAIVWENGCSDILLPGREDCQNSSPKHQGELVVEVVIKKDYVKRKNDAWTLLLKLLGPVLDLIDWSHSMPSGIQGVLETFGIEASHKCILERLRTILMMFQNSVHIEHLILTSDLMTHTGHVVGFKAAGFHEFISNLHVSAPFTESLFRTPVLHLQNAARKGDSDFLSGVVASSFWGNTAPVGTGSDFEILWRELQI